MNTRFSTDNDKAQRAAAAWVGALAPAGGQAGAARWKTPGKILGFRRRPLVKKSKKQKIGTSFTERSIRQVKGYAPLNNPKATGLMIRVHEAFDVPIDQLKPTHVRVLVSQKFALDLVLPAAMEILDRNPWIEVSFFPGDLLEAVDSLSDEEKALCPGCEEKLAEIKSRPKPDDDELWFPKEKQT